jgi:hypothetical protein
MAVPTAIVAFLKDSLLHPDLDIEKPCVQALFFTYK